MEKCDLFSFWVVPHTWGKVYLKACIVLCSQWQKERTSLWWSCCKIYCKCSCGVAGRVKSRERRKVFDELGLMTYFWVCDDDIFSLNLWIPKRTACELAFSWFLLGYYYYISWISACRFLDCIILRFPYSFEINLKPFFFPEFCIKHSVSFQITFNLR